MNRIGVFICHCGLNVIGDVDVEQVANSIRNHDGVAYAIPCRDMCMELGLHSVAEAIKSESLDGVVLTSCTPLLHKRSFLEAVTSAGLASHQIEIADLHKESGWPHNFSQDDATEKAIDLLKNAVERLKQRGPLSTENISVVKSALVIGGGITGIQSALDIADGGYQVYLVERRSTIGGHMLQYSEVFPTLDCPQCIGTPKMVEVAQHPNITIKACSEVESVSGQVGNFKVTIKKNTPYVNWADCTGCGECSTICPMELTGMWDSGMADEKAITRAFAQAVPNKVVITKRGTPPCRSACPAGVNAQGYVALVAIGRFKEAVDMVKEMNPFPSVCGRVCVHPCEEACNRSQYDDPLAIRALKRCAVEYAAQTEENAESPADAAEIQPQEQLLQPNAGKIAIVGAGPGGLTAAHYLAKMGYRPTVLEALPEPGGMMRVGIPAYRLPREALKNEINDIVKLGVEIKTNTKVTSVDELFKQGYKAVFLSVGAHKGLKLGVDGEDGPGMTDCVDFLRKVSLGEKVSVGNSVAVIGGGNAAIDAARTSLRVGAKEVTIVYRRTKKEMPAAHEEIVDALREGVKIEILTAPSKISSDGGKVKLECIRMKLGEPDASGRRRPVPIEGSDFAMEFDTIIAAIGQQPDITSDFGMELGRGNTIKADPTTFSTEREGVFAGGDMVTGPASVIQAIAHGHEAAISIDRYLKGEDLAQGREKKAEHIADTPGRIPLVKEKRQPLNTMDPAEAIKGFDEFELLMDRDAAIAEAKRCLACGGCAECYSCSTVCEKKAIDHNLADSYEDINVGSIVVATGFDLMPKYAANEFPADPDIIDGLQFERILCPSGPTAGVVKRPSDGKEPQDVVLISCVGSRDPEQGVPYCSRVCCMYLAKQALLYKHVVHHGNAYIFYMDQRTTGKGYEEFVQRAVEEYDVRYIRGRVSKIFREGDRLKIFGADTLIGKSVDISCDLVVLGMAMMPANGIKDLASKLGIRTDEFGFIDEAHSKLRPLETSEAGIYVAGTAQGPKDIPDSVCQGSAAADKVLMLFSQDELIVEKVAVG